MCVSGYTGEKKRREEEWGYLLCGPGDLSVLTSGAQIKMQPPASATVPQIDGRQGAAETPAEFWAAPVGTTPAAEFFFLSHFLSFFFLFFFSDFSVPLCCTFWHFFYSPHTVTLQLVSFYLPTVPTRSLTAPPQDAVSADRHVIELQVCQQCVVCGRRDNCEHKSALAKSFFG